MTSKGFISGAILVGVLTAVPAFAQEARSRRDPGGDRGGRVERSSGDQGGRRYAAPRHPGRSSVRQERRQAPPARVYQAPRNDVRRNDGRRYDAPRRYDNNRRYDAPRRYQAPRDARRYDNPRYDNRRYDARRYDNRRYDNRRYAGRAYHRGYAVPRHPYTYRPYVYRSYRGSYG